MLLLICHVHIILLSVVCELFLFFYVEYLLWHGGVVDEYLTTGWGLTPVHHSRGLQR